MKKKVLKGWVTVTKREGRLMTYDGFGFYMFALKRDADYNLLGINEVVKVKVTIEPT